MAFLSLGLDREVSQDVAEPKLHVVEKPESNLSEDAPGNTPANGSTPSSAKNSVPSPAKAKDHGNGNGNGTKPTSESTKSGSPESDLEKTEEETKDDWSLTGMQIIQSVLKNAQNKPPAPPSNGHKQASEGESAGELGLPPELEQLRKQISEGFLSDSRPTPPSGDRPGSSSLPSNGHKTEAPSSPELSSLMKELHDKLAGEAKSSVSTVAPEALSPVMKEIEQKLAGGEASLPELSREQVRAAAPAQPEIEPAAPAPVLPQSQVSSVTAQAQIAPKAQALAPAQVLAQGQVASQPSSKTVVAHPDTDGTPTFATFKFGYTPGKGLLYSVIGHEVLMFGLFLLITYGFPSFREQRLIVGSIHGQDHIIYLPEIGGGTEGQKSPGGGKSKPLQASAAPARASKGFAYPGAQAILSNPPNPTNAFQTVLHPLMVHPEAFKKLVPLPNIVQMAETRLPKELVAPKTAMPHYQPPVQAFKVKQDSNFHRNAKWQVPVKAPQLIAKAEMPKLAAAEQPLPVAPKVQPKPEPKKEEQKPQEIQKPAPEPIKVNAEKKAEKSEKEVAPPSTAQVARLEMHGKAAEPLLSLSPVPLPAGSNAKVPAGEARGRFAIAPGGKLNPNSITPGKANGTPSESPATGQEKSQAANATTELASNAGTGAGHNSTAGGGSGNANEASGGGSAGSGTGSGNTAGTGVGGNGAGNGRGNAGAGAGKSGSGAGTGSGAGSGAGTGSFPGITIQGGEGNEGNDSHAFTVAPQTPYQMTIVATASSGGGLPDFGVFENGRVYTVYVPMQRTPQEADPTWTMQYALESAAGDSDGQLVAPTPVMREWPQIPADLAKNYTQQQVIVSAVLGIDGKLSHFAVKQTPDEKVSTPITHALAKWVFRPAQLNNKPVPVKILIGVPL